MAPTKGPSNLPIPTLDPTLDITLLPPPYFSNRFADDESLDGVGAVAVLEAMVEQRKRSSSAPPSSEIEDHEEEDDSDAIATQKRAALDPSCDAFMKIR